MSDFTKASAAYAAIGVDVEAAIAVALAMPISIHCWQADDVNGFEIRDAATSGGGIMATGNYPGRARNIEECRADYEKVLSLVPGVHRLNLHAIYADTEGQSVARDEVGPAHFESWAEWAREAGIRLDFNPTYFGHPMADSGYTLSSVDEAVRGYWVRHGVQSRRIAGYLAGRQGGPCINNHWVPDGAKDAPADRWGPRARLTESYAEIFADPIVGCDDAVESKLFGLGSEDYVVGSFEYYSQYALRYGKLLCLDMGHFHPTESVADKISALLQYQDRLLIHTSRPMRWDSDHVVLFNDEVRAVFTEAHRGGALGSIKVALDFFDASINRIAAYVIGIRATRQAILAALLDPIEQLRAYESAGQSASKLALMEYTRILPFGEIWSELCARAGSPVGIEWLPAVDKYESDVLRRRG